MSHAVVRSSSRAVPRAGLALLALSLVAFSALHAAAQSPAVPAEKGTQAQGPTETVIISQMPQRRGPIYTLLKKLFCKTDGAVTGASNSRCGRCRKGRRAASPSGSRRSA